MTIRFIGKADVDLAAGSVALPAEARGADTVVCMVYRGGTPALHVGLLRDDGAVQWSETPPPRVTFREWFRSRVLRRARGGP